MEKDLRRRDKFKNSGKVRAKMNAKGGIKAKSRRFNDRKTNELVEIWTDTYRLCKKEFSESKSTGVLIDFDDFSTDEEVTPTGEEVTPEIDCQSIDTLEMAVNYYLDNDSKPKILVLNMASNAVAGGGVSKGKTAQEEEIFRRTNAFMGHPQTFYPLDELEVVYMDQAYIIKDTNNILLKTPIPISIVSCPAIRRPKLYRNQYKEADRELMENKIQGIFELAIRNNIDYIVLGALGCGVYANPKEEVAEIFAKKVIQYHNRGFKIGFAILDKTERDCDEKGRSNKQIFVDVFKEHNIRTH